MATSSSTHTPLISVLMPAYNAGAYIAKAVESVLRQSEENFELIIVDDASTDDTIDRLKEFDDPRIVLIRKQANEGAQAARNLAMQRARGEWIAFLDADDWFAPSRLERLLHHARSTAVDIVADNVFLADRRLTLTNTEALYIDRFGQVSQMPKLLSGTFLRSLPRTIGAVEFMKGHMPGPRNPRFGLMKPFFNRAFLEHYGILWDESVRFSQDTVFYLSCLMRGARFLVVPEAGYFYFTESDGISESADPVEAMRHRLEVNRRLTNEYGAVNPELRSVLEKRARKLERSIAYLSLEKARRKPNGAFLKEVAEQPKAALDFASYWLEQSLWRGYGRAKALARRVEGLRIKGDQDYVLEARL